MEQAAREHELIEIKAALTQSSTGIVQMSLKNKNKSSILLCWNKNRCTVL